MRIKSKIYLSKILMPDVYLIRNDLDTMMTLIDQEWKEKAATAFKTIEFELEDNTIPGELADYLIETQLTKVYESRNGALKVKNCWCSY